MWGSGQGSSNNSVDADMQLQTAATIDSCGFYYPNQNYQSSAPAEYGATILAYGTGTYGDNSQTATNNFCFNCYSFLDFRGSIAQTYVTNARIEHNWGAPIAYGLRINRVNDWGDYDYNIFHAGAFDWGDSNFAHQLAGWTILNGIAFELDNSDWLNLSHEQEWGYANGVVILFTGSYYVSGGPVWITEFSIRWVLRRVHQQ